MALSRLLQPNSTLHVCRLGFSAARAKFFSSGCSDDDGVIRLQLNEETAVEDTKVMLPEHIVSEAVDKEHALPEAASLGNIMAECGGPNKPRTLSDMFKVHKGDPNKTTTGNEEIKHEETLSHYLMMSEKDERPSHSDSCQDGLDLKHSATSSANGQATVKTDRPKNLAEKNPNKDFIQSLSVRAQNSPSHPTKLCRRTGLIKGNSSNANAQRSDKHDRLNLLTFPAGTSTVEDRETSKSGSDSVELKEQKNQCSKISLPTNNKERRQRQTKNSARTESGGYKVLVRFLQSSVSESTLTEFFRNCGEILKIECPDAPRSLLKTACIDFKTKNGLEKALGRSGMYLGGPIIVESATSENRAAAVPVPSLLGDPDIPAALVKNPTRTIRIEPLTEEISSHHIVEALAFCNSKVSGYFLGSSPSVGYVELETESGKERALAKPSINVLGRHLVMLRIDCPRTTAVRITSRCPLEITVRDVVPICRSLGDVGASFKRDANVLDVHFKASEWPNMLKILNSLNGCIVKGIPLHAEPAPIFPPEVLLALWRDPKEREHLKATVQALLLKLENKLDTSELAFLENDIFST